MKLIILILFSSLLISCSTTAEFKDAEGDLIWKGKLTGIGEAELTEGDKTMKIKGEPIFKLPPLKVEN